MTQERKDAEARQQATEERLAQERKDAEARQQATEARLIEERRESRRDYNSQRFWLIANFVVVFLGMTSIFIAVLVTLINGVFGG